MKQAIYTHVVAASEPASYTWTLSSAQAAAGGILAYSGVSTVTPVNVAAVRSTRRHLGDGADGHHDEGERAARRVLRDRRATTTFTAPTGMTERGDVASCAGHLQGDAGGRRPGPATAGATGTRAATAAGTAASVGQLVALAP